MHRCAILLISSVLCVACGKGGKTGDKIDNSYNYFYCSTTINITVPSEDAAPILDEFGADTVSISTSSESADVVTIEVCSEALDKPDNDTVIINDNDNVETQTDGEVGL